MDSNSFLYGLDCVASSGHTLSVEEKTALCTSLVILRLQYKFNRVVFWGEILGIKNNYSIAQGRGEDEMQDRKVLYSLNCMDWYLLPPVTALMLNEVSKAAKGRFMGDPSYVYEHVVVSSEEGEEAADAEKDVVTTVTEERRLAVTVDQIDQEASVVPRGMFIKAPHGQVQANRSFGGLSDSNAQKLENYQHFTQQKSSKKRSVQEKASLNPAMDFMDRLSDDTPLGSWSLHFECPNHAYVIRSHLWPGLTFYHIPSTTQHGYVYIGNGMREMGLPFML